MDSNTYKIFKTGSVTFFTASLFFPAKQKEDVFVLYAFVRIFDNLVDCVPQEVETYYALKDAYDRALLMGENVSESDFGTNALVVNNFVNLQKRLALPQEWVNAFFSSMEMDIENTPYDSISEVQAYMYGSAEVIGLMMAQIMSLPEESYPYAAMLGRAFQYMNMIRDLPEDISFGRCYLPKEEYEKCKLSELSEKEAAAHPDEFAAFIRAEITRYRTWRNEATQGFRFIPKRFRVPIESATDMFDYTMDQIEQNPAIIFKQKVKPSKARVIYSAIKHII